MRTMNTHEYEVQLFKAAERSLRYKDGEDFCEWQKRARAKLTELLGLPLTQGACKVELEYEKETERGTEYRFVVETEPGYIVPCHLVMPKNTKNSVPLTLCLSGHGGGMHVALGVAKCENDENALREWPHRDMASRSVKEGRAALVIEARSFGECSLEGYGTSCREAAKIAYLTAEPSSASAFGML